MMSTTIDTIEPAGEATPWLTTLEACARAKVGRKTLYRAVRSGHLKAARLSRRSEMRFHVEWIDAWMSAAVEVINPHAPGPRRVLPGRPRILMTIAEVAVALSVGEEFVLEMIRRGEIELEQRRPPRIAAEELDRFIQAHKVSLDPKA